MGLYNACAQIGSIEGLNLIKDTLKDIPQSFFSDQWFLTSLIDALAKCGDLVSAQVFNSSARKDMKTYGALMKYYIVNNQPNRTIETFKQIKHPNVILHVLLFNACAQIGSTETLNLIKNISKRAPKSFFTNPRYITALLDAFIKCNDFSSAQALFSSLTIKDTGIIAVMMNGYNKNDDPQKTTEMFNQMKHDGIERDMYIYLFLIQSLSQLGDQSFAKSMIEDIPDTYLADNQIQAALINMWGKIGLVGKAKETFEKLSPPTESECAAMINAYGLNGLGSHAVELYRQIPSELINEITYMYIERLFSFRTCQRSMFNFRKYSNKNRSNFCDHEAKAPINRYEQDHFPLLTVYMILLSSARNMKNSNLAQETYDRMKKLFPQSKDLITSGSKLLANVYASIGDFDKASDIQRQIRESGLKKNVGLSWTVVDSQIYRLRAHDQSHPRSSEIYAEVKKISNELLQHGHRYDSSWVTRPLNEDETIASVLCGHSERLAIAWNFVVNPNTSLIQVTKNLRVCVDCHEATKLIAAIRQCDIIVRDANRIHHFMKNGQCSCNDYF